MTVRENLENILVRYGMFQQQAQKVMDVAIPKINELSDDYQITWNDDCDVYQDEMYNFLFTMIKKEALEWIDEHIPNAWFRESFID